MSRWWVSQIYKLNWVIICYNPILHKGIRGYFFVVTIPLIRSTLQQRDEKPAVMQNFHKLQCGKLFTSKRWYIIPVQVVVSNMFYFHHYLGKIPILTHIFQWGWNHQPAVFVFRLCFLFTSFVQPFYLYIYIYIYGCFQKSWYPKMDGENHGKPYEQMDDLGGKPINFGNIHICTYKLNPK